MVNTRCGLASNTVKVCAYFDHDENSIGFLPFRLSVGFGLRAHRQHCSTGRFRPTSRHTEDSGPRGGAAGYRARQEGRTGDHPEDRRLHADRGWAATDDQELHAESNLPYRLGLLVDTSRGVSRRRWRASARRRESLWTRCCPKKPKRHSRSGLSDSLRPRGRAAARISPLHARSCTASWMGWGRRARRRMNRGVTESGGRRTRRRKTQGAGRGGRGGTQLYDAIFLASDELMKQQTGRKALVVFSDGVDRGSKDN